MVKGLPYDNEVLLGEQIVTKGGNTADENPDDLVRKQD